MRLLTTLLSASRHWLIPCGYSLILLAEGWISPAHAIASHITVDCEILIIGGGLAGVATAYEALYAGRTVCLTEITDWVGGQVSSQGTSALDEDSIQRSQRLYPRGYLEFRDRLQAQYNRPNPGRCWVSEICFLPRDGHRILFQMLKEAEREGKGRFRWFPNTVIKAIQYNAAKTQITGVTSIQHQAVPGTPPLNTEPLSAVFLDAYEVEDSPRLHKTVIQFAAKPTPLSSQNLVAPAWYVVEATETGEVIGLADIPYRQGLDPRSARNPSSPTTAGDPYCLQGYTYTFAMEQTRSPQVQQRPAFYQRYEPYFSYELPRLANFDLVFTYRRIWSKRAGEPMQLGSIKFTRPQAGDISMQNWTWGNDYRPGTATDNLVYNRDQLVATGQLAPGGWRGGLRVESLRAAEELALSYYYWLVAGTTDSQLGEGIKQPALNHRYLSGFQSPMGTAHGLSKYPYIREGRRILGRSYWAYPEGFSIDEVNISQKNFRDSYYQNTLSKQEYFNLQLQKSGSKALDLLIGTQTVNQIKPLQRASLYPDTIGIGHYPIDFHPCMELSPPERPGNQERPGKRQAGGSTYPFQIPLRAMIPQQLDNLLVSGKSITTSHIAAAAYRVHAFEWSVGAATGITLDLALATATPPAEWVENLPRHSVPLEELQQRLLQSQNPIWFMLR